MPDAKHITSPTSDPSGPDFGGILYKETDDRNQPRFELGMKRTTRGFGCKGWESKSSAVMLQFSHKSW